MFRMTSKRGGSSSASLTLKAPGGAVLASTVTNPSAGYQFTGICAGSYLVEMRMPFGEDQATVEVGSNPAIDSNANPASVTLAPDAASNVTIDFGVVNGFCEKQPVQIELYPNGPRFPGNRGPDLVVRAHQGQMVQQAVDQAADVNGDGFIIVGDSAARWHRRAHLRDGFACGRQRCRRVARGRQQPLSAQRVRQAQCSG